MPAATADRISTRRRSKAQRNVGSRLLVLALGRDALTQRCSIDAARCDIEQCAHRVHICTALQSSVDALVGSRCQ